MTEFPEFWWNRTRPGDGYEYIYISEKESEKTPNKSNIFYVGRYDINGTTTSIFSKSNVEMSTLDLTTTRDLAKKIGTNWGLLDIWRWSMLQILYLVEFADYNSQKILGNGQFNISGLKTGSADKMAMKSGCLSDEQSISVVYRGIENIYGRDVHGIDGVNYNNTVPYVSKNRSNYKIKTYSGDYIQLSYKGPQTSGYMSEVGLDTRYPEIQLCSKINGSNTTYLCDYYNHRSDDTYLCVGANGVRTIDSGYGETGLWYTIMSSVEYGSLLRLLYIPN